MADMQVAVGLGRETGMDSHAFVLSTGSNVLIDESMDKVPAFGHFFLGGLISSDMGC